MKLLMPYLLLAAGWYQSGLRRLPGLLALLLTASAAVGQATDVRMLRGQVVDADTHTPLPYVSIGIRGTTVGTVANENGRFVLPVPAERAADSVRFSLLGYQPVLRAARDLPTDQAASLMLRSTGYELPVAVVHAKKLKKRVLGNPGTNSTHSFSRFDDNLLGNQFGQNISIQRPSWLEQVSFHVGKCTYDSLFFRINVFALDPATGLPGANLLPQPVYARVRKNEIKDRIIVDLRRFNLRLTDDVVVTLETIRDLGDGTLQISARMLGGPIFFREGAQGQWDRLPGFGLGIDATVLEER